MTTLLEIGEQFRAFDRLLDEALDGGELTDTAPVLEDFFAAMMDQLEDKVEAICVIIRDRELLAAARREESKRLADRAAADERTAAFLKERLKQFMEAHKLTRLKAGMRTVSIAGNGGRPPLEIDEDVLPDWFFKPPVVDREAIYEVLKKQTGETIPGVTVLARGQHLRIS